MFTIEIEDRAVKKMLQTMIVSLDSFAPEMKYIQQQMRRSNRLTFQSVGRPGRWKPLKDSTKKGRRAWMRRTGKRPPAGDDTPLRLSDALYKSVTSPSAPGAIAESTDTEAVSGSSLNYAGRQDYMRPFLLFQEQDKLAYVQHIQHGLQTRANHAHRAARMF